MEEIDAAIVAILGIGGFICLLLFTLAPKQRPAAAVEAEPVPTRSPPHKVVQQSGVVAFVDVETTGLTKDDRVVSVGCLRVDLSTITGSTMDLSVLHLAFNPGRPSHPQAIRAHGYSDASLAGQPPFVEHVAEIIEFLQPAQLIVAHNASFDMRFINREFAACGIKPLSIESLCTMLEAKRRYPNEGASLTLCGIRAGVGRSGKTHSALEDAWLAMRIFFHMQDVPATPAFHQLPHHTPENWRGPKLGDAPEVRKRGRPRKAAATSTPTSQ